MCISISYFVLFTNISGEYSFRAKGNVLLTVADLKKCRRVRAKDHLFLIIR